MSAEVTAVIQYVSWGVTTDKDVARASRKFAACNPFDFNVLRTFHARAPIGVKVSHARSQDEHRGLADIIAILHEVDPPSLAKAFAEGEADELREQACELYADAILRLDAWLLQHGYRKEERDRRPLAWMPIR